MLTLLYGGKDVTVTTDNFFLSRLERAERQRTARRRDNQNRRKRLYFVGGMLVFALILLAGPSLLSHSPIGRSIVSRTAAQYGIDAQAGSLRVGWITPLRINGLQIHGREAGSSVWVEQIDTEMTVTDLLRSSLHDLGSISLRGVDVNCTVNEGICSIEQDLRVFFEQPTTDQQATIGVINVRDVTITVADAVTGESWKLSQANTKLELLADSVRTDFTGALNDPSGSAGSIEGSIHFDYSPAQAIASDSPWSIQLTCDTLPLSAVSLLRRRFPELAEQIPASVTGDASGSIEIRRAADASIDALVRRFQIRNLQTSNLQRSDSRGWGNQLASVDGRLRLDQNRIVGEALLATTDFASFRLDGGFSRSITLVGASDNPVRWLDTLEGTASVELDLQAFDRALPNVLPLRDGVEILSGRVVATVEPMPSRDVRLRRLSLRSDALRARANGQAVVIDPVEMTGIVASTQNQIRAEQFELNSVFASAVGHGDLQSGQADLQVDFGRLSNMLRPIVNVSSSTLAGIARGKVQWNASATGQWRLVGSADANDLLIVMANGTRLRQPACKLNVDASGQWDGRQLASLTHADAKMSSSGLNLHAELVQAISSPNASTALPIRLQGDGRLQSLADTLGPWLPSELHDFGGAFSVNARAEVSASGGKLTAAMVELNQPRVAYQDRYFAQPEVKLQFDGEYNWSDSRLLCRSFTVAGEAFSAAGQGEMGPDKTDLEIAWRAKLERLQGSVRQRVASRNTATVTQVGYRAGQTIETNQWLVMGDCDGRFIITGSAGRLGIDTEFTGKNVAMVQPPMASAAAQITGPMQVQAGPRRSGNTASGSPASRIQTSSQPTARVVWAEPNIKIDGIVQYDRDSGEWTSDSMKIAADWFASNLSGSAMWNATRGEVIVKGPARLKMNEIAARLSQLAGTQVQATGIHETPLEFRLVRKPDDQISLNAVGSLGWESANVAGVMLGRANVPVRLTETSVFVSRSTIPVGAQRQIANSIDGSGSSRGTLNVAGAVHYRPGPLWMRVEPGRIAEAVQVTPEMTNRWLKYLAPLAAEATAIDGVVGAELDEAIVVFDALEQSRVSGRMNIDSVQLNAGPLGTAIAGGIRQLRALSQMNPTEPATPGTKTLVRMPAQSVDFLVDRGVINHQRLFLEIDRASVVTSGNVTLDGRLNLVAQVPLDARWLGSDLQGLAGQSVSLPIDGTLSKPSLDSSGVRSVVTQLGLKAVQETADNYLQKQLNRGIDRIFGR